MILEPNAVNQRPRPSVAVVALGVCCVGMGLWLLLGARGAQGAEAEAAAGGPPAGVPALGAPPGGVVRVGDIELDPETRSVAFPATLNLAEGVLEVIVATPRGRLHEALLKTEVSPMALQALLYALDLNNGPRRLDSTGRRGDLVDIELEYSAPDGRTVREPVESWIRDTRTGKPKARTGWVFVGSTLRDGVFLAEEEGNICLNYSVGSTLFDNPEEDATDDTIHVVEASRKEPGLGAPVRVVITARGKTP